LSYLHIHFDLSQESYCTTIIIEFDSQFLLFTIEFIAMLATTISAAGIAIASIAAVIAEAMVDSIVGNIIAANCYFFVFSQKEELEAVLDLG